MAARGCKCADGSYRQSCCRSTKRSTRGTRSSRNRRSNKSASPTLTGPMSPTEYATRRKQQAFVHALLTPQGRKALAYGAMQAEKGYTKVLGRKAAGRVSLALYAGGRVGTKFIPIVGQVSLAYDTYRLGKWMHGKLQG
jgi:hypothetical protein